MPTSAARPDTDSPATRVVQFEQSPHSVEKLEGTLFKRPDSILTTGDRILERPEPSKPHVDVTSNNSRRMFIQEAGQGTPDKLIADRAYQHNVERHQVLLLANKHSDTDQNDAYDASKGYLSFNRDSRFFI